MERKHSYEINIEWTGNSGSGTSSYEGYRRNHRISAPGRPAIEASSDPQYLGDADCYNPEELFLSSVSACHMLWFLHLCADAGVVVTSYKDNPIGTMGMSPKGRGQFTHIVLRPHVTLTDEARKDMLEEIHRRAGELCFIASTVNCPIDCEPVK